MSSYVEYRDATDTGVSPSPIIWGDCPVREFMEKGNGIHIFEDFVDGGIQTAAAGRYGIFLDAGCTFSYGAEENGVAVLLQDGDAADDSNSLFGAPAFQIARGKGDLWFEARVKFSSAAADRHGWFVGLSDATATTIAPLTAASALSTANSVGFHKPEENSTAVDTTYRCNDVAAVEVNSNLEIFAASTYMKLGMKYSSKDNILRFYVNGAEQAGTKEIPVAAGTDFPNDAAMKFYFCHLMEATAATSMQIDWVKVAQRKT